MRRMLVRCLALTMMGTPVFADTVLRHFDIQTQAAGAALNEFARQADITLVFSSDLVARHQTAAIRGDFTIADGLRKLLDGTGLSFKQVTATTIAISAPDGNGDPADPPAAAPSASQPPAASDTPIKGDTNMNHRSLLTRIASLFALGGAVAGGGHTYAQEAAAAEAAAPVTAPSAPVDASAADTNTLEEVVVTGTASSGGLKKLDASYQITTASLEEIKDAGASSAADLLKIVPSVWAESGGGEAGPNIELAGYPGGSGAPYVTYSINGSPIYPSHNLSFLDDSSMFRLDETIERAEVVLGGPGVLYSDGQMGATANFILRQGTPNPTGDIGITLGTEGMYRVDGFYGGPLAQDWYMSVGGFYRVSDGVRPSQYPADEGGQFTGTLTHTFDDGRIMFYGRALRDKNLFVADIPLIATGSGKDVSYSAFPGFNPLTGWFAGSANQGLSVQECPGCAPLTANLADGRGASLHTFGSNLDINVTDGISLSDKMQYTGGDMPTIGIFTGGAPPTTLAAYAASQITAANGNATVVTAGGGPATGYTAAYAGNGGAVNPNTYVMSNGFWVVDKQLQSFTNDLRFTFEVLPGNHLTVGNYVAAYSSDDTWYLGNNELMTATPNSQLINLTLNNGAVVSNNGLTGACTFCLVDRFQGLNVAFFLSDSWRINQWLFDAGYRIEEQKVSGTIENDTAEDLDTNPLHLYNKGVSVPNGSFNVYDCELTLKLGNAAQCDEFEKIKGSWAVGGNYEFTPHMSMYARINQGVHFPSFDDLRNGTPQTETIQNYEIGYRVQTETLYADIDIFDRQFSGVPFQQFVTTPGGTLQNLVFSYGVDSKGMDFTGRWEPIRHVTLSVTGNWQDSVYKDIVAAGGAGADGNVLQRQPRFQARFTPAYDLPMGSSDLRFFLTYSYIGLRYSDPGNAQVLPSFQTLDAGIVSEIGQHFEVRLQGTNLTNTLGITEQDARAASGTSGTAGGFALGRPIFGREANLALKYKF
jgi:outer membrane receptor protein involved in Fe transport